MSKIIDAAKRAYLKYVVNYRDQQKYWDQRYAVNLEIDSSQENKHPEDIVRFTSEVAEAMKRFGCSSVLEVGCGRGKHRSLNGWLGLDFSVNVFKQNGLKEYLVADFTQKIPLPDKSFDCVMCQYVLLHVPYDKISGAVKEMCRVAKKLVIVCEPNYLGNTKNFSFNHNVNELFSQSFSGTILFTEGNGVYVERKV